MTRRATLARFAGSPHEHARNCLWRAGDTLLTFLSGNHRRTYARETASGRHRTEASQLGRHLSQLLLVAELIENGIRTGPALARFSEVPRPELSASEKDQGQSLALPASDRPADGEGVLISSDGLRRAAEFEVGPGQGVQHVIFTVPRLDLDEDRAALLQVVDRRIEMAEVQVCLPQAREHRAFPVAVTGFPLQRKCLMILVKSLGAPPEPQIGIGDVDRGDGLPPQVAYLAADLQCLLEPADGLVHMLLLAVYHSEVVEGPALGAPVARLPGTRQRDEVAGDPLRPVTEPVKGAQHRDRQLPGNVVEAVVGRLLGGRD